MNACIAQPSSFKSTLLFLCPLMHSRATLHPTVYLDRWLEAAIVVLPVLGFLSLYCKNSIVGLAACISFPTLTFSSVEPSQRGGACGSGSSTMGLWPLKLFSCPLALAGDS